MCTVVLLRRPDHDWPLLLAANRDEARGRPWAPPGRHWPDRAGVTAGLDRLAGGSWLGVNDDGVAAGVLNRSGSLGPDPSLRSRGELVLEALDHADAEAAARALSDLDGRSYRSFNMVIADDRDAFWLRSAGTRDGVAAEPLPEGLSMLTSRDLDDPACGRTARYRPLFEAAAAPDPAAGDWRGWQELLADGGSGGDPRDAMRIADDGGFGTLSSALVALPARGAAGRRPTWLFAAGPPGEAAWEPVRLEPPRH